MTQDIIHVWLIIKQVKTHSLWNSKYLVSFLFVCKIVCRKDDNKNWYEHLINYYPNWNLTNCTRGADRISNDKYNVCLKLMTNEFCLPYVDRHYELVHHL
jgi:hypothetical protein